MEETNDDIKEYELAFLARAEEDVNKGLDFVRKSGGDIYFEGPVERIALAYEIEHEAAAHFGYVHVRMSSSLVPSLMKELQTAKLFLRFLMITPPFVKPKPRPAFRPRTREAGATATTVPQGERPSAGAMPLSNEALEKKIEEMIKE